MENKNFNKLKDTIKNYLYKELKFCLLEKQTQEISNNYEAIKIMEKINNIDEVATKYVMKLTNDYIKAKMSKDGRAIAFDTHLFKLLDFDVKDLDERIDEMSSLYGDYNKMPLNKLEESVLQTVFNYFGCPSKLPNINKIRAIASKFGVKYTMKKDMHKISGPVLDNPNGEFYKNATQNGLSFDEIFDLSLQYDKYMSLYTPPKTSICYLGDVGKFVTNIDTNLETNSAIRKIRSKEFLELYKFLDKELEGLRQANLPIKYLSDASKETYDKLENLLKQINGSQLVIQSYQAPSKQRSRHS